MILSRVQPMDRFAPEARLQPLDEAQPGFALAGPAEEIPAAGRQRLEISGLKGGTPRLRCRDGAGKSLADRPAAGVAEGSYEDALALMLEEIARFLLHHNIGCVPIVNEEDSCAGS